MKAESARAILKRREDFKKECAKNLLFTFLDANGNFDYKKVVEHNSKTFERIAK
jgi:hypothetical protein